MDFEAGLPILVDSFIAVVLFSWLTSEVRWMETNLLLYAHRQVPQVTDQLKETNRRIRSVAMAATLVAPTIMAFSGQLDSHGIAHIYNDALQIIAPTTSAFFSAAVAWLLIRSPMIVHRSHRNLLSLFPRARRRNRDFW
jgi:hypothetical protein